MSRVRNKYLTMAALCGTGILLQTGLVPSGCMQYYGQALLTSLDFCKIFNCTSGTFSNLCEPVPLFVDCPNYNPTTTP
jgi:hypothetical protein